MPPLVFTRDRVRRLDALAASRFHIPTIVLMENAARGLAIATTNAPAILRATAKRTVPTAPDLTDLECVAFAHAPKLPAVLIACGAGNNGGDGYAAARHLVAVGVRVVIIAATPLARLSGDALVNARIARAMGIPVVRTLAAAERVMEQTGSAARVLVDALIGTGLSRPIEARSALARHIVAVNQWKMADRRRLVVAADIPSGLDADTGEPLVALIDEPPTAVRADLTVTFVGLKRGMLRAAAAAFVGRVVTSQIGAPMELARSLAAPGRSR